MNIYTNYLSVVKFNCSYAYNADGMRLSKTVGSTTTKYYYVGSQLVEMIQGSDKLHFTYDATGASAVTYNGTNYYYLKNAQGDILGIVNTSGTVVVSYTYDAWGNMLSVTGSMASTLGAMNPLRYRGYVYDIETGLYYLQSRYYDPSMGRFICADVFTSTGQGVLGTNMYAYCNNNPVNFVDPSGTIAVVDDLTVLAAALGVSLLLLISLLLFPDASEDFVEGISELTKEIKQANNYYNTSSQIAYGIEEKLRKTAGKYEDRQCVPASNALTRLLKRNNEEGYLVEIQYPGYYDRNFVWSFTYNRSISDNGYHCGVEHNGIVYCNIHPYGLPYEAWINDFDGFGEPSIKRTRIF